MKSKNKYGHLAGLGKKERVEVTLGIRQAPPPDPNAIPVKRNRRKKPKVKTVPQEGSQPQKRKKRKDVPVRDPQDDSQLTVRKKRKDMVVRDPQDDSQEQVPKKRRADTASEKPKPKKTKKASAFQDQNVEAKPMAEEKKKVKKDAVAETLHDKMVERLNSSRFRFINEQLYTKTSEEAASLFAEDETAFELYHQGYRAQMDKWPLKPSAAIITLIQRAAPGKKRLEIADLGCGEAHISARLRHHAVHSFDFVALNDRVTPADMAHVPLEKESMDVAVFCLSLMGSNLGDYVREANRILKPRARLFIAEIASRFTSFNRFRRAMETYGFRLDDKKSPDDYFVVMELTKTGKPKSKALPIELNPCLYKKR